MFKKLFVSYSYDMGPRALYWVTKTCLMTCVDWVSFWRNLGDLLKHFRKLNRFLKNNS